MITTNPMTKLKEVAALAGVSLGTASLALNGGNVNEVTRVRVAECARRLNYVPNRFGRNLKAGRAHTICLLVMTSAAHPSIIHKTTLLYYLVEGVLMIADQAKYSLRLEVKSHDDPGLLSYFDAVVGDRSLDGVIIVPQFLRDYPFLHVLKTRNFPYVMFRPARFGGDVNYVDMENAAGGKLVAELFLEQGYRRVAMINGPEQHVDALERERGFFEHLSANGISPIARLHGDFTIESGFAAMESIDRQHRPEAVFCANDYMAAGAMKFLWESGRRIPDDVAVVGYDNHDICTGLVPALTTVDHRLEEIGRSLASQLIELIEGRVETIHESIPPRLVPRFSHLRGTKPAF